jgi:hypothetical protein
MFAKTAEKSAWKIISDPVAEERQWLAAAEIVKSEPLPPDIARTPVNEKLPDVLHAWLSSFGGLATGIAVFFIAFGVFYTAGSALAIPQALTTDSEWLSAVFWMVGLPSIGCSLAGYYQRPHAKNQPWVWTVPLVPWMTIGTLAFLKYIGLPATLGLIWFGMLMGVGSFSVGRHLAQWWQLHLPRMKLTAPALPLVIMLSVVLWGVIASLVAQPHEPVNSSQMSVSEGWFGIKFLGVMTVALCAGAAQVCGSRQLGTSILAAFTLQTPLLLFYFAALLASLVYAGVRFASGAPDLGALAVSACCIGFTSACTVGGGTLGWWLRGLARRRLQ